MNRIIYVLFVIVFGFAWAVAQGPRGIRNYDPNTELTVKGTIQDVQEQTGKNGNMGTHLILNTESGTLPVHVGPSSYIAKKQFSFMKGDEIQVLGSKVLIAGNQALLAREITKNGKTLVLRNAQGIPQWAGAPR